LFSGNDRSLKEIIEDARETVLGVILVGVGLSRAIFEDSYFLGIEEKLRGKLLGEEPNQPIPQFSTFFSSEMLLFYAIKNKVIFYDMGLPCALLEPTFPEEILLDNIFSYLSSMMA
jgi:hypothetical protein